MPIKSKQPLYNDGIVEVHAFVSGSDDYGNPLPPELGPTGKKFWYMDLGITDTLRITSGSANVNITKKLRTRQDRSIEPEQIFLIDGKYYKVINAFHFFNKEGYAESDVTLGDFDG